MIQVRMPSLAVPIALLLTRKLTPAAKLLWVVVRLDEVRERNRSHAPTHLARRTGLARSTVYEAIARLADTGWFRTVHHSSKSKRRFQTQLPHGVSGKSVRLPFDLIKAAPKLRPQLLVCYGLLQILHEFRDERGRFKWMQLHQETGLHLRTLKRALTELAQAGWVSMRQKNRLAPIEFVLHHPDEAWRRAAASRLQRSQFAGQALMQEYLTLIVDSKEYVEDGATGFLINPRTQQLLQFDRYYPLHRVAFEFNGRQHYEATELYSKEQVALQRERDRTKRSICKSHGITLVIVHAEDLSLSAMLKKVPDVLPRRDLRGFPRTIQFLEETARRYRKAASHARWSA